MPATWAVEHGCIGAGKGRCRLKYYFFTPLLSLPSLCRLGSLDQLASLPQDAVQACCRLTSAALQPNCWDACVPPPAVSPQVMVRAQQRVCEAQVVCSNGCRLGPCHRC